jgi:branched-chain amino acid transport system permease protein
VSGLSELLTGLYLSFVSGISYGLIISLLSSGLSLIYGVMRIINTAHGSFYVFGAFVAFLAAAEAHLDPVISILVGVSLGALIGMASFSILPSRLRFVSDPDATTVAFMLLAGIGIVLQQGIFYYGKGIPLGVPSITAYVILLPGGAYISGQTAISMLIAVIAYAALIIFLGRTKIGKGIRAYSQDRESAIGLGVNARTVTYITFMIGAALAALSGSLLASIYSVSSSSGWDELVIAFVIITLGGVGSIFGSVVAGLIYGVIYSTIAFYYPALSLAVVALAVYLVIVIRPTGLFGEVIERV